LHFGGEKEAKIGRAKTQRVVAEQLKLAPEISIHCRRRTKKKTSRRAKREGEKTFLIGKISESRSPPPEIERIALEKCSKGTAATR
jgi:hypothetical protein